MVPGQGASKPTSRAGPSRLMAGSCWPALPRDRSISSRAQAACFDDARNRALVVHEVRTLVGQRILGLLTGLDDLNVHRRVRLRIPWPSAVPGCLESKR